MMTVLLTPTFNTFLSLRFNSENYLGSKARPREGRPAAQFVVKSYDGSESVRSDIGKKDH